jgi:hypothetical protein
MSILEIRSIYGLVLWTGEATSVRDAVEKAVAARADLSAADLRAANLRAANLRAANLSAANLRAADLSDADLRAANLRAADLRAADLSDANLRAANLSAANLSAANLSAADLRAANLRDANLRAANLRAANLRAANLRDVREDLFAVLAKAPNEVTGLLAALREGRVDGTQYEGDCACLVGTIANLRHEPHDALKIDLEPDATRPAEVFFLAIGQGDTPENSAVSRVVVEWIEQWLREQGREVPAHRVLYWRGDVGQLGRDLADAGVDIDTLGRWVRAWQTASEQERIAGLLDRWAAS